MGDEYSVFLFGGEPCGVVGVDLFEGVFEVCPVFCVVAFMGRVSLHKCVIDFFCLQLRHVGTYPRVRVVKSMFFVFFAVF